MNELESFCPKCGNDSMIKFETKDYNCRISDHIFTYRECIECSLIFLSNIPENLEDYYQDDYFEIPSKEKLIKIASKIEYQIEMIKTFTSKGRLLDIGSAFGAFAFAAKDSGFIVDSIEMNELCCKYLSEEVKVNVYQGDKPQEIIRDLGFYDVITLWHNIEHLIEPWSVLKEVAAKISPGGIILVATPSPNSFAFKLLGSLWPHIDAPRHINLIPEKLLTEYIESYGFQRVMKTTCDKGGLSWNRFSWQRILMNSFSSRILKRIAFFIGWIISLPFSIIENRESHGSAYTAIYQKTE